MVVDEVNLDTTRTGCIATAFLVRYHALMPLFTDTKGFKPVKEHLFKREKEMQKAVEANLETIYGLQYVTSEFAPQGDLRIDTLAFDREQKSLVIIEYKKGSSWSVIDQGYAYLALMLNNKADFVLKFNECMGKNFNLKDINWEASRVIFVSPSFNAFQRESLGFQDLPFELWEIRRYEGNLVSLNQLQASKRSARLSDVNIGNATTQKVQREVKTYSVDDLFREGWASRELYDAFAEQALALDPRLTPMPRKAYIGLQIDGWNLCAVNIRMNNLILHFPRFQPKDFKDPSKSVTAVKDAMKHYNTHIAEFRVQEEADVQYGLMLMKQALQKFDK